MQCCDQEERSEMKESLCEPIRAAKYLSAQLLASAHRCSPLSPSAHRPYQLLPHSSLLTAECVRSLKKAEAASVYLLPPHIRTQHLPVHPALCHLTAS